MKNTRKAEEKFLAQNKKVFIEYEVIERIEAGLALNGGEVKSSRMGHASLKGSFIDIDSEGQVFVRKMHITPYKNADQKGYEPEQKRRLLLHKNQITHLIKQTDAKGITVLPLDLHISHNRIKITIAICRAKKQHDRRNELRQKSQNLEINRALKHY